MRVLSAARLLLAGIAATALLAGPVASSATADGTGVPSVTSVSYGYYLSPDPALQADTVFIDWANVAPDYRVYGTAAGSTNAQVWFGNVTSIFRDSGSPRTRISYRAGVCSTPCSSGGIDHVTWSAWAHPTIPAAVSAAAPTLTATPGTKASPGMKIKVAPGAQTGAPAYLIFNYGGLVGRVGPGDLTFVDAAPARPQNSYQVAACYADCNQFAWPYWGDGYRPVSALSAAVKAWTANTATCKAFGPSLYNLGLNWRNACKP